MRINDEQARAAYAIAVRVYADELTIQAGTDELKRVHRLNSSSARDVRSAQHHYVLTLHVEHHALATLHQGDMPN